MPPNAKRSWVCRGCGGKPLRGGSRRVREVLAKKRREAADLAASQEAGASEGEPGGGSDGHA